MGFRQGLFWKSFAAHKKDNLNAHMKSLIRTTFLKDIKSNLFIFTGTGTINFEKINLNTKTINKLRKQTKHFFLFEPISYYFKKHNYNLGFYSEFHNCYNNSKDLRAAELDSLQNLASIIGTIEVNLCDYKLPYHFSDLYPDLVFRYRDVFLRQSACAYMETDLKSAPISKKFWCGNGRYTIHRHLIMCKLANLDGNYSWFYDADLNFGFEFNWLESINLKELSDNNNLLKEKNYALDFEHEKVVVEDTAGYAVAEAPFNEKNLNYKKTFDECFVAIINETRFAQPSANISEKVIDAIIYGKPFILAAPPYSLEYMQKLGFKTFSEFWSEDYDREENHEKRLKMIYEVIDEIDGYSITELQNLYEKMIPILEHNRKIVKQLPLDNTIIYE